MASSSHQEVASKLQRKLESKDLPSLRRLGRGFSGFIYETTWLGKTYTRKDFPLGSAKRNHFFEKEANSLFDLDHPNIVKCFGYTVAKSSCSLLQEYVDDNLQNTIQRRIEEQGKSSKTPARGSTVPFDVSAAMEIILQIASGMKYLHDNEVVHGDLKLTNVLVCSEPDDMEIDEMESGDINVKVADFGLVQTKRHIKLGSRSTRHFEVLMWKAPELFRKILGPLTNDLDDPFGDSDIDGEDDFDTDGHEDFKILAMADVYSFGLICSHILGGKLVYPDLNLTQLREQRMHGFRPELPSATCPDYLRDLIYSCLEYVPSRRPSYSYVFTRLKVLQRQPPVLMKVGELTIISEGPGSSNTIKHDGRPHELLSPQGKFSHDGSEAFDGAGESKSRSGRSQREELMRGGSSGKFLKESDAERNAPDTITPASVVPVEARVEEDLPDAENLKDPIFTLELVGAAVSSFFTEVISEAKSAYGHMKKLWNVGQFDGAGESKSRSGRSQREELMRGGSSGKFLKESDAERNAPDTITPASVVPVEARVEEDLPDAENLKDPIFTPALVGAAVSSFFTEVISAAKSAYGHKKKCEILLESVNKLQPHIDAAGQHSAGWEKAQADGLEEIKDILDKARSFATKWSEESKSERRRRTMTFWRWGKLPAELRDIICRIEEAKLNVISSASIGTLTSINAVKYTKSLDFLPQQIERTIVGVDIPFNRLKASILQGSHAKDTASHLGLHGRGGAGKTFLAQMLHNDKEIIEEYGAHSIVWITAGLDARISDLYKTMAITLKDGGFEKHYAHRSLKDQRNYLWNALAKKKVFLILDDVWQEKCEEDHETMYWLNIATGPGSATLITTRNCEVLSRIYAESEVVLCLSEEDSWTLFRSRAFRNGTLPSTISEELAREVCKECKGLPLALKVVGSAMVGKVDREEWSSALGDLRQSKAILGSTIDDELFGRLRWSYNKLEGDVLKTCFLYFAAFPEDHRIPTTKLFNMWISEGLVGAEDEARAHLRILEKRSLIVWFDDEGFVQVHDILRDLALYIIDRAEPGECACNCFFQSGKVLKSFPRQTIRRMSFINGGISESLDNLQAPHLQVCLLSGLIDSDEQLSIFFSNSDMTSLKYLDLSRNHFKFEEEFLDFRGLHSLTHLDLSYCESLEQLPESIGELKCLTHLDLSGCGSLRLLKSIGELKCLTHLDLSGCGSLRWLPESIGELKCLTHLDLSGCGSLRLLESIGKLKCLTHLDLSGCESLEQLPESIRELKCLTHLDLSGYGSLRWLPESIGELKCLTHLDLSGCGSLRLLESIGELKCLTHLDLSGCGSLWWLPESIGELKCLTHLDLSGCGSLEQLPASIGELKCLTHLDLSGCGSLTLLKSIGELKCLTHLYLSGCGSLWSLPESIGELKCLTHLDLSGCGSLTLLKSIGELKCLTHLDLSGCGSLRLLKSIGELKCLTHLDLSGCGSLWSLPESIGELKCLTHLDLSGCGSLTLLKSIGELKCLTHLDLSGCGSLRWLPESIGELKCLTHLDLSQCYSLEQLPERIGELKCLTHLDLRWCESLGQLPSSVGKDGSCVVLR